MHWGGSPRRGAAGGNGERREDRKRVREREKESEGSQIAHLDEETGLRRAGDVREVDEQRSGGGGQLRRRLQRRAWCYGCGCGW